MVLREKKRQWERNNKNKTRQQNDIVTGIDYILIICKKKKKAKNQFFLTIK